MIDMYYKLVKAGLRDIQKVPDQYREAVIANLTSEAIEGYGHKAPTYIAPSGTLSGINLETTPPILMG